MGIKYTSASPRDCISCDTKIYTGDIRRNDRPGRYEHIDCRTLRIMSLGLMRWLTNNGIGV